MSEVEDDIDKILSTPWSIRKGTVVPTSDSVTLSGGAVEIDAVFLYADLASSSQMAKELDRRVAAKIFKSFLATSCRIIRDNGGHIRSFDGDRVMGIFMGDAKNSNAACVALRINHCVTKSIRPKFEKKYESVRDASFKIKHGVGVDSGTVLSVRGGARNSNDLIWIGRAPNLAAKLSDIRNSPYHSFITATVFNKLSDAAKFGGDPKHLMWEKRSWKFLNQNLDVYRSNWTWKP